MELDLSYAHRRFLGLTSQCKKPTSEEKTPPEAVWFSPAATQFLRNQLEAPGIFRSGPLFGRNQKDLLLIDFAAPSGYELCQSPELFKFDTNYVLGWVDALRASHSEQPSIDWVGCWMSFPDLEMRTSETEATYVKQARQTRLADDYRCLTFIGWQAGDFTPRAYVYDSNFGPKSLDYDIPQRPESESSADADQK